MLSPIHAALLGQALGLAQPPPRPPGAIHFGGNPAHNIMLEPGIAAMLAGGHGFGRPAPIVDAEPPQFLPPAQAGGVRPAPTFLPPAQQGGFRPAPTFLPPAQRAPQPTVPPVTFTGVNRPAQRLGPTPVPGSRNLY